MIAAVTTRPCKQLTKRIGLTLTKPTHQVHPDYRRYNKTLHQLDPEVAQAARLVRHKPLPLTKPLSLTRFS